MRRVLVLVVMSAAGAGAVVGCAASPGAVVFAPKHAPARLSSRSPSLVLPAPRLLEFSGPDAWPVDEGAWEFGRNDWAPTAAPSPAYAPLEWVEIRTRDRLRTNNGRPREFSTTHTRTRRTRIAW